MSDRLKTYVLLFFLVGLFPQMSSAQIDDEYFVADQLLRQQKFEMAAEKFAELHDEHPNTYLFLDKLTACFINLKKYDEAISVTQEAVNKGNLRPQGLIRLAEIHHISGNTEQAFSIWDDILKKYAGSQQVYLKVARAMKERRAYEQAIDVLKRTRELASNSNIITTELAEAFMQAGNYEEAIGEYLQLVNKNPNRMNFVQRRLMRLRDDYVYDVAILEISDFLDDLSPSHPSYSNLQQLEIWLLMERNLFERALVTAKNYEEQSPKLTYSLYNLGSDLLAEQQFELAEQAYSHYIENGVASLKERSKEELADVYIQWARYLENYNLDLSSKRNELYLEAFSTLESLHQQTPNYSRIDQVLMTLSELALDVLHEPKKAQKYLSELQTLSGDNIQKARESYIEGRLHLYNEDYTRARISFSRSNKQERIGNLAEKSRYYLALTDFYAGDYEFAKIQLNALERQNTSYFANDAVQLRLWIQNGLQADSSGSKLKPFANAIEHFSRGEDQLGINTLKTILQEDHSNPLIDEALMELSTYKDPQNATFVYQALSTFLEQQGQTSPLYERLLWEKARMADQFVTNESLALPIPENAKEDTLSDRNSNFVKGSRVYIPTNIEELVPLYEEILLQFPGGFYSSFARDRIQELQNIQT